MLLSCICELSYFLPNYLLIPNLFIFNPQIKRDNEKKAAAALLAAQNGVLTNGGDVNSNGTSVNKEPSSNGKHHALHNGNGYATQNGTNGKATNGFVADRLIDAELTQRKIQK